MPIYMLTDELVFPSVEQAEPDGLLAAYGDLSVKRLLLAYAQGVFPWYDENSPILWWSPPERAILEPNQIHISRSLKKILRSEQFEIKFDTRFAEVIHSCATVPRRVGNATWIVPEMEEAYLELHEAGFAHSIETYLKGVLVGGIYGVSLGGIFFGESMFSKVSNASKVAFVTLAQALTRWKFDLIDCQIMNPHLQTLGAYLVSRKEFLARLKKSLLKSTQRGIWKND